MKKAFALALAMLLALSAFGALAAGKNIPVDAKHFPDPAFRNLVAFRDYDYNEDGKLTPAEIRKIVGVELTACNIRSLAGIEYFPYVKWITAGGNYLKQVDVSKNTRLESLVLGKNNLTKLTLGKQKYLNRLILNNKNTGLKKVDISGCPKLLKVFTKGKKTAKGDAVQWKIGNAPNRNWIAIPRTCSLYYGRIPLYMGR